MAIYHVFEVPLLFFNFLAIQKGALAECSFGFSIQLLFFVTFLLVDIAEDQPIRDLLSKWRFLTNQKAPATTSDDFQPISELSSPHVTIFDQSELSIAHVVV